MRRPGVFEPGDIVVASRFLYLIAPKNRFRNNRE